METPAWKKTGSSTKSQGSLKNWWIPKFRGPYENLKSGDVLRLDQQCPWNSRQPRRCRFRAFTWWNTYPLVVRQVRKFLFSYVYVQLVEHGMIANFRYSKMICEWFVDYLWIIYDNVLLDQWGFQPWCPEEDPSLGRGGNSWRWRWRCVISLAPGWP